MVRLFLIFSLSTIPLFILVGLITEYLELKPKTNKFRQWWSRHIVDLDNRYE